MSALTDPQIIISDGKPAFAVIPWREYQELISQYAADEDVWIPHEIVKATSIKHIIGFYFICYFIDQITEVSILTTQFIIDFRPIID